MWKTALALLLSPFATPGRMEDVDNTATTDAAPPNSNPARTPARIVVELETPGDSRSLFRLWIDDQVVGERLTAAQAYLLVDEILDRISIPPREFVQCHGRVDQPKAASVESSQRHERSQSGIRPLCSIPISRWMSRESAPEPPWRNAFRPSPHNCRSSSNGSIRRGTSRATMSSR